MDSIDLTTAGYDNLESSMKLKLLVFLCDEGLGTEKIRNWIDDQNVKFVEKRKEAKEKLSVTKDKIKNKAAKAHVEMLACKEMVPVDKSRLDAVRAAPIFRDNSGHMYWRLKGCFENPCILLQVYRCIKLMIVVNGLSADSKQWEKEFQTEKSLSDVWRAILELWDSLASKKVDMTLLIVQLRLYVALYRQVLWDKKLKTIVNNESEEIIRMLNTECNEIEENPSLESPEFNTTPSTCTTLCWWWRRTVSSWC